MSEVLHDVLRLLQSTICSVIRVAAEPHALCARIGITVEQYAALMAESKPHRLVRLQEMLRGEGFIDVRDELAALEGETEVVYPSRLETFAQRLARDGEAMAALVGLTVNDLAEFAEMPFPDAVQQAQEKVTRAWTQARRHCIEANTYAFQLCEGDDRFHWVLLPWSMN